MADINSLIIVSDKKELLLGLIGFFSTIRYFQWLQGVEKPIIFQSKSECVSDTPSTISKIIAACPTLHRCYLPPFFFSNCHLQFVPFTLTSWWDIAYPPFKWHSEIMQFDDGGDLVLDWACEIPQYSSSDTAPILLINHGAFCNTNDLPGQWYIGPALRRGWNVCVMNRRGHKGKLSSAKFNFFGCTQDLREVIARKLHGKRPNAPILMIGISAGSGLVARYMGEQGLNQINYNCPEYCTAAIGVSPGYDIEVCMARMKYPYFNRLLNSAKTFHQEANKSLLGNCHTYDECMEASDIQTWLDYSWSMAGYNSKEEYYDATNPMRVVKHIRDPALFINSCDDPLCCITNVYDNIHIFDKNGATGAAVVVTKTGSHCSFYEIGLSSWSERVTFEFFDAALSVRSK
jgi:hypothetical protein